MSDLKNINVNIDEIISKITNYGQTKNYSVASERKVGHVLIKIYNSNEPGLIRIYETKKGLSIDDSLGNNKILNEEIMEFLKEIYSIEEKVTEDRVTFEKVDNQTFETIISKIKNFSDDKKCYMVTYKEPCSNELYRIEIKDSITKQKAEIIYYNNRTLYLHGQSYYLWEEINNIVFRELGKHKTKKSDYVNKVISHCNEKYLCDLKQECVRCNNKCNDDCGYYLQNIHYGNKDRYDCQKVMNYYVVKYGYRYSTEIEKIINANLDILQKNDSINVLSIGCGPCTELLGLSEIQKKCNKQVLFNGIDINEKWKYIHDYLNELFDKDYYHINFFYKDIFEYIEQMNIKHQELKTNILIFQYVISDFIKYENEDRIYELLNKLNNNIINHMKVNSLVILNDINHVKLARQYFDVLAGMLEKEKYQVKKVYFKNKQSSYFEYGELIEDNNILYEIPGYIEDRYNPWSECKSSSLIIRKV